MSNRSQAGLTVVELLVVIVLVAIFSATFFTFFKTSLTSYFGLQTEATNLTTLAAQSQRVATVLRGAVDVQSADANDLVAYAYFYPTDSYTSVVHYYLNGAGNTLLADVTPMTANPPIGTPQTSLKKTYTILTPFRQSSGLSLFNYLDASGATIATPVADEHTIQTIRVNLGVDARLQTTNNAMSVEVNLRNRKANL